MRNVVVACVVLFTLIFVVGFFPAMSTNQPVQNLTIVKDKNKRVIDKIQGETFSVEVEFTNTGKSGGEWTVNVALEGEQWTWAGIPQILSLAPSNNGTLTWTGNVPTTAPLNSFARLVVYYGDSFEARDLWIHVISTAKLDITASSLR